jgi:hypothetical protein
MNHVAYTEAELSIFYVVDKKGKRIRPRHVKRNKRSRPYWADSIKTGILTPLVDGTLPPPGPGRVANLAAFYATHAEYEVSPFNFENL